MAFGKKKHRGTPWRSRFYKQSKQSECKGWAACLLFPIFWIVLIFTIWVVS